MKKELCYLSFYLSLSLILNSCRTSLPIQRPIVETCITGDSGLICTLEDRTYIRPSNNDICTNPEDYQKYEEYVLELEMRYSICLANPKRCN